MAGIVTCSHLLWKLAFHQGYREFKLWWTCFCRPSLSLTGFANGHYKYTLSAVSSASVGLATIWSGVWWSQKHSADDASITFS